MMRHAALLLCLSALTACGSVHEALHPRKEHEDILYLTLLPHTPLAYGAPTEFDTKITNIQTRELITPEALKATNSDNLTLYALDSSFTDLQVLAATPTQTGGLYHFTFTPHRKESYRFWAYAPLKEADDEFPYRDTGTRTPGHFDRIVTLAQTVGGSTYTLHLDTPLRRFHETEFTLEATGEATITEIIGFYDDYRTVIYLTPNKDNAIVFAPDREGYIKLFTRIATGGKTITLPFTVQVAKD